MNKLYKPIKELMGKSFKILGYKEEMFNTNCYTIVKIEYENEVNEYYTSSIVLKRLLNEFNSNEKIPIKVELKYGNSTRGKWYAFRELNP